MTYNLSYLDGIVRLIIMLTLVIVGWLLNTFILYPIGMVLLVSALGGYCPLYHMLGISTCKDEKR